MLAAAGDACATSGIGPVRATIAAALHFFAASQCLVREPWPHDADIQNGSRFDFIIVGGGTAGSTLAARLSKVANFKVLLLEAGGDPPIESIIPGFRDTLKASPYDWNFTSIENGDISQVFAGGMVRQPRGKMLGGSGSMNDMVYARGFPIDYYEWASIVGETWNWTNVLHYFVKTEDMTDEKIVNNAKLMRYHGRDGEIEVSGFNDTLMVTDSFLEAFHELGFKIVDDMTYPHMIGAGRFSHTIRDGRRDSSLTALLNKIWRSNLFVLKDAFVTKILIENDTAVGVQVEVNNSNAQFFASKEVIVSAGTFNTAKLLLISGIGPRDHLEALDIDVVQDLPVGNNLHDHVMVLTFLAVENGTCTSNEATKSMDIIQYLYDKTGSLSRSDSMGAYISFNKSEPNVPDFALYPVCIPQASGFYDGCMITYSNNDICSKLDSINQKYELLSIAVVLLKPKSRGRVRLNSRDPNDDPFINFNTFNNADDLEYYPEAIKVAWSLADTTYFKNRNAGVVDLEIEACKEFEGDELIKCSTKAMVMAAWHAVGTAAMGSVLDSNLNVYGVNGLRVVDASVMPKVVRGNTNAPVVMIAEIAADLIKDHYKCPT